MQGKKFSDRLSGLADVLPQDRVSRLENIPCMGKMATFNAFINFRADTDPEYPNRPYLHFTGEMREVEANLPFNVGAVTFPFKDGLEVDVFYEFSDAEIANLSEKGLFRKNFTTPSVLRNNNGQIEVPIQANFKIVHPMDMQDLPVVFVDITNAHELTMNTETSGYVMADYFQYLDSYEPKKEEYYIDEADLNYSYQDIPTHDFEDQKSKEQTRVYSPEELAFMAEVEGLHERVMKDHVEEPRKMREILGLEMPRKVLPGADTEVEEETTKETDEEMVEIPTEEDTDLFADFTESDVLSTKDIEEKPQEVVQQKEAVPKEERVSLRKPNYDGSMGPSSDRAYGE